MIKVTKKVDYSNNVIVEIENEKQEVFSILAGGADIYWMMTNYNPENAFVVTEEDDKKFYYQIKDLLEIIKENDDPMNKTYKEDIFEWSSDAYGKIENAHKLTIKKEKDQFVIHFWQNPNNEFLFQKLCTISFCLSGSRNEVISKAFSSMLLEYKYDENFMKTLKKAK